MRIRSEVIVNIKMTEENENKIKICGDIITVKCKKNYNFFNVFFEVIGCYVKQNIYLTRTRIQLVHAKLLSLQLKHKHVACNHVAIISGIIHLAVLFFILFQTLEIICFFPNATGHILYHIVIVCLNYVCHRNGCK